MSKRRDPESRRRLLDRWQRSGLSAHEFAGRAGVSQWTLYKWRRELRARGVRGKFVEIVTGGSAAAQPRIEDGGLESVLEIALPAGIVVRVSRAVDEALLRLVVRALL